MGIFDDNPYIKVGPTLVAKGRRPEPGAYASGDWWTLRRKGAGFELEYLSGQLDGRARTLAVAPTDAEAIRGGGDEAVTRLLLGTPGAG